MPHIFSPPQGNLAPQIEFVELAPALIITEAEGISSNDNDVTVPTSAAVLDHVASAGGLTSPLTADLVVNDNIALAFGTGADAHIEYNGTDLLFRPAIVGTGDIVLSGASFEIDDSEGVTFGTGKDATIQYDGTDLILKPAVVGTGELKVQGGAIAVDALERIYLDGGTDTYILESGANQIDFFTNGSNRMRITTNDVTFFNTGIIIATGGKNIDLNGNNLNDGGVVFLREQAEADASIAGQGQIWVDTATPNVLKFTDDADTDFELATLTGAQTFVDTITFTALPTFSTALTTLGTIATGVWEGTVVANAFLDADTAHLTTNQTFSGVKTFSADILVFN